MRFARKRKVGFIRVRGHIILYIVVKIFSLTGSVPVHKVRSLPGYDCILYIIII